MFSPFPKMARLSRDCVITEKLDGTNSQIWIVDPDNQEPEVWEFCSNNKPVAIVGSDFIYAGSRTRWITPGKTTDNYGFASWVHENASELVKLGSGRHFGEWYGNGIQRGYGLDHKRFALFNTSIEVVPACCSVVPKLWSGPFDEAAGNAADAMQELLEHGSVAVPGFMQPEGLVFYHTAARIGFKKTFNDNHKEAA